MLPVPRPEWGRQEQRIRARSHASLVVEDCYRRRRCVVAVQGRRVGCDAARRSASVARRKSNTAQLGAGRRSGLGRRSHSFASPNIYQRARDHCDDPRRPRARRRAHARFCATSASLISTTQVFPRRSSRAIEPVLPSSSTASPGTATLPCLDLLIRRGPYSGLTCAITNGRQLPGTISLRPILTASETPTRNRSAGCRAAICLTFEPTGSSPMLQSLLFTTSCLVSPKRLQA